MNERWVCKQCFADNEDGRNACHRCGWERGAAVAEADAAAWTGAAASGAAQQPPGWRRWLRYWWVLALVIVLAVGYLASARRDADGSIEAGGTLSIEDLRPGDCFSFEDSEEVSEVDAKPCDEPHAYELFHDAAWTESDEYPSDQAQMSFVYDACAPAFGEYVGLGYEASVIDFVWFSPTEEGWAEGDRTFQCALVDPDAETLSVSLRGAGR